MAPEDSTSPRAGTTTLWRRNQSRRSIFRSLRGEAMRVREADLQVRRCKVRSHRERAIWSLKRSPVFRMMRPSYLQSRFSDSAASILGSRTPNQDKLQATMVLLINTQSARTTWTTWPTGPTFRAKKAENSSRNRECSRPSRKTARAAPRLIPSIGTARAKTSAPMATARTQNAATPNAMRKEDHHCKERTRSTPTPSSERETC